MPLKNIVNGMTMAAVTRTKPTAPTTNAHAGAISEQVLLSCASTYCFSGGIPTQSMFTALRTIFVKLASGQRNEHPGSKTDVLEGGFEVDKIAALRICSGVATWKKIPTSWPPLPSSYNSKTSMLPGAGSFCCHPFASQVKSSSVLNKTKFVSCPAM